MKQMTSVLYPLFFLLLFNTGCNDSNPSESKGTNPYEQQLKDYWYSGVGELTSYKLQQARYGEMREGHAVLIFVTEDFSTKTFTKADQSSSENISILKLNATRKFVTGIYPYSMMTSTFFPFPDGSNAIKVSTSSQEWCGHTYMELRDEEDFEIMNHSYFQSEAEQEIKLKKAILEDDLWTMIRLNPDALPSGKVKIIPSFTYLRLSHEEIKAYLAEISLISSKNQNTLVVEYPELDRTLKIVFGNEFPFPIQSWSETCYSGWGEDRKQLTTTATRLETIKTDYWTKNHVADSVWREKLGLE